jgi:enoyl-CoA hydratase
MTYDRLMAMPPQQAAASSFVSPERFLSCFPPLDFGRMHMTIDIQRDGPITTVLINRPAARNAVNHQTALALREAFTAFDADAEAKVAVFGGVGPTFCAGYDLKEVSNRTVEFVHDPAGPGPMGPTRMLLSKPVIGAIESYAVAGGLELALWCDMRVAAEGAVFGVFCRRWGVPLIDGGTVRLPRLIGLSHALDMILTGRPVAADEAHRMGLVNRLVPLGQALSAAQELAREIAKFPQICLRADRSSAEALRQEGAGGNAPLRAEAQAGAKRFASGRGRGGDFASI